MEEEDGQSAANSEIRYISLELMKLAQQSGKSFAQVAEEYLKNACHLQSLISGGGENSPRRAKKGALSRQK